MLPNRIITKTNRTADHIFTLVTLIDRYVHRQNEKYTLVLPISKKLLIPYGKNGNLLKI